VHDGRGGRGKKGRRGGEAVVVVGLLTDRRLAGVNILFITFNISYILRGKGERGEGGKGKKGRRRFRGTWGLSLCLYIPLLGRDGGRKKRPEVMGRGP